MAARRNALGRGLGALLPGSPSAGDTRARTSAEPSTKGRRAADADPDRERTDASTSIRVDRIDPNPEQPRRIFDPANLEDLADSLRRHGMLQPVVVRRAGDRFELLVGERRWRAARQAGLREIPAVVSDADPQDRLELAIVENVQRQDLNPIELAHAFQALTDTGYTQEEVGQRLGMDRSSVANHLRLLELGRSLQQDVEEGRLRMGHAKALLQVSNPERRLQLRNEIVEKGLSVRDAERRGREIAGPSPTSRRRSQARTQSDPHLQQLSEDLRLALQTQVRFHGGADRGRIEIEYYGPEDLERLTAVLLAAAGG